MSDTYKPDKQTIIDFFKRKNNTSFDGNKTNWKYLQKHNIDLYEYLKTCYPEIDESVSVREILYCIENDFERFPTCPICGKLVHFSRCGGQPMHFSVFCSDECRNSPAGMEIRVSLYRDICIKTYGVDNTLKVPEFQEKRRISCQKKFGTDFPLQNKEIWNLTHQPENYVKCYETKKQNHSFNVSGIEHLMTDYLNEHYKDDFETQFKCDRYPFNCDYYIKSLDLFIEIQGHYTHGPHPYNPDNQEDKELLQKYIDKGYNEIIDTWTIRDVKKRNIALSNNLNFLEIYSWKIDECVNELNKYIEKHYYDNKEK